MSTDGAALDRQAAAEGIHRIAAPTPFEIGGVDTYLIEDEPLTLVDPPPNSDAALEFLEHALDEHGHRVEDLELLLITHQHIDHFGLAARLVERSGAKVAALDRLAPLLAHFEAYSEADDAFAAQMMARHGTPADLIEALLSVVASYRRFGASVQVTRPLADGSSLAWRDRSLTVLHRPGHSPSDTLFYDPDRELLFTGDHLLPKVSSNPLLSRPLGARPGEPTVPERALINYLASMKATREMKVKLVLPGHGEPFVGHQALIDERIALHRRRVERIHELLEIPRSAFDVARELWGNVAVTQTFLTISEVIGHIDILMAEGRVRQLAGNGVVRFVATEE